MNVARMAAEAVNWCEREGLRVDSESSYLECIDLLSSESTSRIIDILGINGDVCNLYVEELENLYDKQPINKWPEPQEFALDIVHDNVLPRLKDKDTYDRYIKSIWFHWMPHGYRYWVPPQTKD